MAGRYYFFAGASAAARGYAYDFDGNRQAGDDVVVEDLIPSYVGEISGATATATRIALIAQSMRKVFVFDRSWNPLPAEDVALPNVSGHNGICATDTRWVLINSVNNELVFYDFEGNAQSSETQSLATAAWTGLFSDAANIYLVENTNGRIFRRSYTSATLSTFISSLGTGRWEGGTSTSTRFLLLDTTSDRAVFYNHSGVLESSEAFSLVSGTHRSVLALEESDATLTITRNTTDIREGVPFVATFAFSGDVTNFASSDITVSGASKGTFTTVDARTYTLVLTPSSGSGTVSVSVASGVVSPGNTSASESWTRSVRATATITFDKEKLLRKRLQRKRRSSFRRASRALIYRICQ